MLGNFFDDANTDTLHWNCSLCQNVFAYFLIDDVCISTDSLLCNGGIDLMPCVTSVQEDDFSKTSKIFPNPASEILTVSFPYSINGSIEVYDLMGKIIDSQIMRNEETFNFSVLNLSEGLYLIRFNLLSPDKGFSKKIIVKH